MEQIPVVEAGALTTAPGQTTKKMAQVNGKFYVRLMAGRFQNLRRLVSWPLIALFFTLVWVPWDGHPLLMFSFPQRRIFAGPLQLSWYDLPLLAGLLIAGATLLFFAAVAYGRVWCGFACPQSIWSWIFIRIEHWTEGDARRQRKQDDQGLTLTQWLRRISKHLLWLLVALATAVTFTGYFVPLRELLPQLAQFDLLTAAWCWVLVMAGLTYVNAGLVREKICLHACPYSRFQGVMFDSDTRTVSYDAGRGEPRGRHQSQEAAACGDCVDCSLCVQVCPVGIDIRDGLQLACIDCGACIDACDGVMDKLGRARSLIRFASQHQLSGQPSPLLRPRLLGYAAVALLTVAAVGWGFTQSGGLLVEVARQRGQLFTERPDDTVCNDIRIKAEGFIAGERLVQVAVDALDPAYQGGFELLGPGDINLSDSEGLWQSYRVCARAEQQPATQLAFTFSLGPVTEEKLFTFMTSRR
ncbi:MAG: cytochrome c oxidase accessory protein CcoG [Pseudomonadota bacterium]|nr:cytochrome c oxidase accessory protein CcoG [Pseudomonadota bacterium]